MKKIVLVSILLLLAACTDQAVRDDGAVDAGAGTETSGAQASGISDTAGIEGTMLAGKNYRVSYEIGAINDPENILSQKIIYFDFDSSELQPEYAELIKHHGKYLALNAAAKVRLEGHTDERGSREYNIALADRRAQSVKRLLLFEGVSSKQISIISYGEEKPADFGHDEQAWRLNRRVEIIYE